MQKKRFLIIMLAAAALLAVPLIAMRFTGEMKWGVFDFIVAGVLLFGAGIFIEIALRILTTFWSRMAALAVIFLALFLVWAELAVGLFGTPFAGN